MAYDGTWAPLLRYQSPPPPTPAEPSEEELVSAHRKGDRGAGHRLIENNMKTVMYVAKEYRRWGIPLDDLVQQGSIGLLKAAERFDPKREVSLRSYAAYWIRAEIRDYVVRGYRIVRLGTTRTERRALRTFRKTEIRSVEHLVELSGMPEERCRMLWPLLVQRDHCLDAPGQTPSNALRCVQQTPETAAIESQEQEIREQTVRTALAELTEREREIIQARLMSEEPATLESLGKQMGVSRERVRQLEKRAKGKLAGTLAPLVA